MRFDVVGFLSEGVEEKWTKSAVIALLAVCTVAGALLKNKTDEKTRRGAY